MFLIMQEISLAFYRIQGTFCVSACVFYILQSSGFMLYVLKLNIKNIGSAEYYWEDMNTERINTRMDYFLIKEPEPWSRSKSCGNGFLFMPYPDGISSLLLWLLVLNGFNLHLMGIWRRGWGWKALLPVSGNVPSQLRWKQEVFKITQEQLYHVWSL